MSAERDAAMAREDVDRLVAAATRVVEAEFTTERLSATQELRAALGFLPSDTLIDEDDRAN